MRWGKKRSQRARRQDGRGKRERARGKQRGVKKNFGPQSPHIRLSVAGKNEQPRKGQRQKKKEKRGRDMEATGGQLKTRSMSAGSDRHNPSGGRKEGRTKEKKTRGGKIGGIIQTQKLGERNITMDDGLGKDEGKQEGRGQERGFDQERLHGFDYYSESIQKITELDLGLWRSCTRDFQKAF